MIGLVLLSMSLIDCRALRMLGVHSVLLIVTCRTGSLQLAHPRRAGHTCRFKELGYLMDTVGFLVDTYFCTMESI